MDRKQRRSNKRESIKIISKLKNFHSQLISNFVKEIKYLDKNDIDINIYRKIYNKEWNDFCHKQKITNLQILEFFDKTIISIINRFKKEENKRRK